MGINLDDLKQMSSMTPEQRKAHQNKLIEEAIGQPATVLIHSTKFRETQTAMYGVGRPMDFLDRIAACIHSLYGLVITVLSEKSMDVKINGASIDVSGQSTEDLAAILLHSMVEAASKSDDRGQGGDGFRYVRDMDK